jgi:hypothetical protein
MNQKWFALIVTLSAIFPCAAEPTRQPEAKDTKEMDAARSCGIMAAQAMQKRMARCLGEETPCIRAWLARDGKFLNSLDQDKPDPSWRKLDPDKLVTHNSDFWQLYYEIAPGDPGLAIFHGAVLLAAGDAARAQYVLRLSLQRKDLDQEIRELFGPLLEHTVHFLDATESIVKVGTQLHDKKKYDSAIAKYDEALRLSPRCGVAAFEKGFSRFHAKGGIGSKSDDPDFIKGCAECRRLDPFQTGGWQGYKKDIPGLAEMCAVAIPLWDKNSVKIGFQMEDADLEMMSLALQAGQVDDLALVVRQIHIVRKGRYRSDDSPFIARSLQRLVPGKQCDATLRRLKGPQMSVAILMDVPVAGQVPEDGKDKQDAPPASDP